MAFNCDRQSNRLASSISVLAITIGLVAAQSASEKSLAQTSTSINGAGASTVNTLFVGTGTTAPFSPQGSWLNVYGVGNPPSLNNPAGAVNGPVNSGVTFKYAPVGSGAGITAFFTQTPPAGSPTIPSPVSFAATDDPLTGANVERVATGSPNGGKAVQVPVVGVGIALAFNAGINEPASGLKLSRITYCGILNGNITNWSDARIKADNGGKVVSTLPIKVVVRQDSSGSTFVLSNHLDAICKPSATPGIPPAYIWNRGVGTTVKWPTTFIKETGGGAVATRIASTAGTIGYVDSATRLAKNLPAALLQNKSGSYVGPTTAGIQNALSSGKIVKYGAAPAGRLIRIDNLADPTRASAYPISTVTYVLFYDKYASSTIAAGVRGFVNWALGGTPTSNPTADNIATARGYAPLPSAIKDASRTVVNTFIP
ncbi:MAG: substrate-binding domain-containing protein [Nostoc sp. ChiSLP02]|nr:substrate-binding domain-containing protein [Nostoc sp. DedSLP05]MDZ8101377.1 substrate-binding domain-containing protein [Nostoc sp. DedSLP01]MDZ8185253.1 substrate-binding domain-containing protein [Nostoc sp. ChiSLP02]